MILLRPTVVDGGRLLYQVVAVDREGRERVISPPLSRERAVKVAAWAISSRWATSPSPSPSKAGV